MREHEKVRPARSKHPKIGIFTLAGRTFSRKSDWRGCAGRVFSRKRRWMGGAGRTFSRKRGWRGCAGRAFSRISSRVILLGELCRAVALVVGPLLAVLTLQCAATPYGWHGGQPAQATIHRVNVRMKGPKPPAVGLSVATGCNVWRLGAARRRSGVMFGWLCSRVRTATPRPRPGGASHR